MRFILILLIFYSSVIRGEEIRSDKLTAQFYFGVGAHFWNSHMFDYGVSPLTGYGYKVNNVSALNRLYKLSFKELYYSRQSMYYVFPVISVGVNFKNLRSKSNLPIDLTCDMTFLESAFTGSVIQFANGNYEWYTVGSQFNSLSVQYRKSNIRQSKLSFIAGIKICSVIGKKNIYFNPDYSLERTGYFLGNPNKLDTVYIDYYSANRKNFLQYKIGIEYTFNGKNSSKKVGRDYTFQLSYSGGIKHIQETIVQVKMNNLSPVSYNFSSTGSGITLKLLVELNRIKKPEA